MLALVIPYLSHQSDWNIRQHVRVPLVAGLLFFLSFFTAHAQGIEIQGRDLSVRDVYDLFQQQQKQDARGTLVFRDCRINSDGRDENYLFAIGDYLDESEDGRENVIHKPRFDFDVEFRNCTFNEKINSSVVFGHVYFTGKITFHNSSGYGIRFNETDFWNRIEIFDVTFRYLEFQSCHFLEAIRLNDNEVTQVSFDRCDFIRNNKSQSFGFQFENRNIFYNLSVSGCEFLDNTRQTMEIHDVDTLLHDNNLLRFNDFDTEHLSLQGCVFDCTPHFGNFSVTKSAAITENRYYHKVAFAQAPLIPADGSIFPYQPLAGRIGTLTALPEGYYRFYRYDDEKEYRVDFRRPWVEIDVEKRIVPVYSKLLEIYRVSSDIASYNSCYNQMKRIEKTVSKIRYESNDKFIDWFRWKMDIFLEKFSAYGTDPVLSLYNSLLCILAFAALYAIAPSEEDNLRFHNIQKAVYRYVSHFSRQKKHFFTADELYEREVTILHRMRLKLLHHMDSLPPVVGRIGMPFYYLSYYLAGAKRRVRSFIRFNVYQDWSDLTSMGRAQISMIITVNFIGFLLWGVVMRLVNSFTLSLNAFVTLGYGEIEAKGIARYFCVVEGLIGWFLLSIFSVSLISQILH